MQGKSGICTGCTLFDADMVVQDGPLNPDVVVVGGFPLPQDITRGPFHARRAEMVRSMVKDILKPIPVNLVPVVNYFYAVQCCPENNNWKVDVDIIHQCSPILLQYLDRVRPKAIIAMGSDAVKGLGFKDTISSMRGGIYDIKLNNGESIPMVATYHIAQVDKNPGLLPVVKNDMSKAIKLAMGTSEEQEMRLQTPYVYEEVIAALDEANEVITRKAEETGKPTIVTVDTETTSVTPYVDTDRMIAVSLSWDYWCGLAYPVEHRDAGFTPDQVAEVLNKTERLLSSKNVILAANNGKFDVQWLAYKYRLKMKQPAFDTMLMEHLLEEDKKGEYSLKDITKDRFPSLGRYEGELQEALEQVRKDRSEDNSTQAAELRAKRDESILEWWAAKEKDERVVILANLVTQDVLSVTDTKDMADIKMRKLKGVMTIPKKYSKAVSKLINNIPVDVLAEIDPSLSQALEEVNALIADYNAKIVVTYEDIPMDTLLRYAAIDALTTRLIFSAQLKDMAEDDALIAKTSEGCKVPLNTKPIRHALKNITMPLSYVLTDMEYNGITVDRDKIHTYIATVEEKMAESLDKMYTEVGYKFNTSASAPDVARILYTEMGLPVLKRTEGGAPSTDAQTLKELYDSHESGFLTNMLTYRKLDKCLNTYLKNWLKMSAFDGRIHCNYNQIGTATYRLSSSNPNLGLCLEVVKLRELSGHPTA